MFFLDPSFLDSTILFLRTFILALEFFLPCRKQRFVPCQIYFLIIIKIQYYYIQYSNLENVLFITFQEIYNLIKNKRRFVEVKFIYRYKN